MSESDEPRLIHLAISQIARDAGFQMRTRVQPLTVKRYENVYKSGKAMPPVTVAEVDGVPILVDGWHRVNALENLERTHVEAMVHVTTREEALWMAARANLEHGLPLKNKELREVFRAYVRSKKHELPKGKLKSYRDIGAEMGKPHGTIYTWMKKDFPKIAKRMGGTLEGGPGGLAELPREDPRESVASAKRARDQIATAFASTSDPQARGEIIEELSRLLDEMKGEANWDPSEY